MTNSGEYMKCGKSCTFFGHRYIDVCEKFKQSLYAYIERLIKIEGYESFYFGGFGEFDDLCWQIVTRLRTIYPYIRRIYCLTDYRHLNRRKRPLYLKDENYEEFVYLNVKFEWWFKRIYYRNIAMIDACDYAIFYVKNSTNSGAYKTYQYALSNKKQLLNTYEMFS